MIYFVRYVRSPAMVCQDHRFLLCKRSIAVFVSIVLPLSTVQNTFNLQKTTKNVNKSFYNELLKIKKVVYFK